MWGHVLPRWFIRILSILDVHNPFFTIIPFEFANLVSGDLPNEFPIISSYNITKMIDLLADLDHGNGEGALQLNVYAPSYRIYDIVSFINPHSQTSSMTLSRGHILCGILNSKFIDLIVMICMTIIFHFPLLHFSSFIILVWFPNRVLFLMVLLTSIPIEELCIAIILLLSISQTLDTFHAHLLPFKMSLSFFLDLLLWFLLPLLFLLINHQRFLWCVRS